MAGRAVPDPHGASRMARPSDPICWPPIRAVCCCGRSPRTIGWPPTMPSAARRSRSRTRRFRACPNGHVCGASAWTAGCDRPRGVKLARLVWRPGWLRLDRRTADRPLSAGRRRHPASSPGARRRSRLDRLARPVGALPLCRKGRCCERALPGRRHEPQGARRRHAATQPAARKTGLGSRPAGDDARGPDRGRRPRKRRFWSALARRFELGDGELLAAALCLAVESDPKTARLVAAAQTPVGGSRPLVGFLATIFAEAGLDCVGLASGAGRRIGLFGLGDEAAPLTERSVHIPLPLVAALAGRRLEPDGLRPLAAGRTALSADACSTRRRPMPRGLRGTQGANGAGHPLALHARGRGAGRHRRRAARSGRRRHGRGSAARAQLLAGGDRKPAGAAPRARARRPVPARGAGRPSRADRRARRLGRGDRGADPGQRVAGRDSRGGQSAPCSGRRAGSTRRPPRMRRESIARARAGSPRSSRRSPLPATRRDDPWSRLTEAIESGASQLDMLARRSSARVEREDLVIPGPLGEGLDLLVDRIRLRNRLADDLGSSLRARYRPGVRALFTGESGTGKTLAAHWLARRTGLPLYRVDLAAMTSKWIGETEKNLSTVLDARPACRRRPVLRRGGFAVRRAHRRRRFP